MRNQRSIPNNSAKNTDMKGLAFFYFPSILCAINLHLTRRFSFANPRTLKLPNFFCHLTIFLAIADDVLSDFLNLGASILSAPHP
jgi:hypothetical protein